MVDEGARAEEAAKGVCVRLLRLADALARVGALAREVGAGGLAPGAEAEGAAAVAGTAAAVASAAAAEGAAAAAAALGAAERQVAGCSQRLLGRLAAHAVLGGGVARTLETLREAGPMECVGDTLQELGPLVALVGTELRTQPALQLQAKEALASALMLRYAELALEMSDSYGTDEAHAEGDGVMRGEMLRRLLENLEDVRRFFAEQEGGGLGPADGCQGLEALQERLQRAVRAKWLGEAQGPGASPFRTRGEAAAATKGASSTKAALSKGMGQLGSKMSIFGKDMSSKLEAKLEEAREAREKAAERERLRAEERAKAEVAALPPLPPMG